MTSGTLGVYGGSFDPPHRGHVALVRAALEKGLVDSVVVVPVFSHALHKKSAPFDARLSMAKIAFAELERVVVSDIEARLPAPSYTLNTLRALGAEHPGANLRLLVGTDILSELSRWHRIEEVRALAPLHIFRRRGAESEEGIDADLPEISSSELRSLLSEPESAERRARLDDLIGPAVRVFAERGGYYSH